MYRFTFVTIPNLVLETNQYLTQNRGFKRVNEATN